MKRVLSLLIALIVMAAPMAVFAEGGSGTPIPAKKIVVQVIDRSVTFNGSKQYPFVKVYYKNDNGKKVYLKEGKDYSKKWVKRTDTKMHTCTTPTDVVSGYTHYLRVKVTLNAPYSGTKYAKGKINIFKAKQPVKFSKTSATVKYSKYFNKKVSMKYTAKKQTGTYSKMNKTGKITVKKISGSKRLYLDKKGNIKVKKGTKKGTYKIKIKATAKSTRNYKATSTTKVVTVKVK